MTPTEHLRKILPDPRMSSTVNHLITTNHVYAQAYADLQLDAFRSIGDIATGMLRKKANVFEREIQELKERIRRIMSHPTLDLTTIVEDMNAADMAIRACQEDQYIPIVDKAVQNVSALLTEVYRLRAHNNQLQDGLRTMRQMIREAIEELFGPVASLESEEATLLRGPEPCHDAEAIVEALQRVRTRLTKTQMLGQVVGRWLDNTDTGSQLNEAYQEYLKP